METLDKIYSWLKDTETCEIWECLFVIGSIIIAVAGIVYTCIALIKNSMDTDATISGILFMLPMMFTCGYEYFKRGN